MFAEGLFHSFRPLHNPLGFGVADFVLLAVAVLAGTAICLRAAIAPYLPSITKRTPLAMLLLGGLVVLLRLALLPSAPIPTPSGADDFSYVLLADTLWHGRLANPSHELGRFFEAVFVLQEPTYSSIYPLGQGMALALGRAVSGSYWTGVLLSVAAIPALSYWMLRGFVFSKWAFAGGLLAAIQFGPLSPWMNSYWGGAVSACAGCLVFGSLPRLKLGRRYAAVLGCGLGLQLLTRPFEFLLLMAAVGLYWVMRGRPTVRTLGIAAAAIVPACALSLLQNQAVTGSLMTLPYVVSRAQYGVPTTLTFQKQPTPSRHLTAEQELDYRAQAAIHGSGDSAASYLERLLFRLGYLRFFVLTPLLFAVLAFLPDLRKIKWAWIAGAIAIFLAGTNFYPYFYPHYVAAALPLFLLAVSRGLENLSGWGSRGYLATRCVLTVSAAHFAFWYAVHFYPSETLLPATRWESWDFVNHGDPDGRIAINRELARISTKQLVFVRYAPQHRFQEWIHNDADIDQAHVVWANDLGPEENEKLRQYFRDRRVWLLEPDAQPPRLTAMTEQRPESLPKDPS